MVCALYVPGVAFGDIDKLRPVTLTEMNYSKYGAKASTFPSSLSSFVFLLCLFHFSVSLSYFGLCVDVGNKLTLSVRPRGR